MKKLSIRARFSLTIGLFVFAFTMVMLLVGVKIFTGEIQDGVKILEGNITYVEEYAQDIPDSTYSGTADKYITPYENSIAKERNTINSPDSYRVAINVFNQTLDKTIFKLLLASLSLGVIGFILAYFVSGHILKPFGKLADDILNIDKTDKPLPIDNPDDEIGKIKKAFNALLQRLNTVFERQENFSSNVAHELKTPLAVMKMYPETLDENSTIEEYKEVIAVEKKNIDRMSELVNTLLEYSRTSEVKLEAVMIKEVVDNCLEILSPLIEEKKLTVYENLDEKVITTSRELFTRLVYNLISNATRYNKEGGAIYIDIEKMDLTIRDTGIGIPQDKLDLIFEPLYCVDKSRSRELGGSGLGLAISKKIADTLGYKIEVASKSGHGTEFTIKL